MERNLPIVLVTMLNGALLTGRLAEGELLQAQQIPPATTYEGQRVGKADLAVWPLINLEPLQPLVAQKAGESCSAERVQSSVAALLGTHQFGRVDVEVKPETQGQHPTFVMEPAYYIGLFHFPGAEETFSYSQLLEAVNYPLQDPYEPNRVQQGASALERFLARQGYFDARVKAEASFDDADRLANIIYHVTLNRRAKFGTLRITGLAPVRAAELERALRSFRARLRGADLRAGRPYSPQRIQAATRFLQAYLAREGHLASQIRPGEPRYDRASNRAALELQVTEGPKVRVRVEGAHVSDRVLRKLIPIYEENAFDQDLVEEGERNLVAYFQAKGFFDVSVNPRVTDEASAMSLVYHVDRGSRHRVMSVRLTGNRHFSNDDLASQILVKPGRFLSRGKFSQDLLRRSADNLTAFYIDEGFADVKVQPQVIDREPGVYVTFAIAEGERTLVDSLRIEGNQTQSLATLAPDGLNLRRGQPYSRARLTEDRNQIIASYLNLGYPNAAFRSTVVPLAGNPHRVAVTYQIAEGPRVRVGQVTYLAQKPTRKEFLERNTQVDVGSPLSEGKLLESESNLYNLGVFDWANVSPRRPIADQRQEEVVVRVHEARRNSITYGVGLQSISRAGGLSAGIVALPGLPSIGLPPQFKIIEKNIFSPQGSLQYSRLNLRGLGETAAIATLLSRLDQRANVTYSQPRLGGLDWSALWSLSVERTTQNPLFTARLGSASFQLDKPLDPAKTEHLQLRYSFQRTSLTHLLIQNFVAPEDLNVRTSRVSVSFVRDTRDKPLDAHRGFYQTADLGISPKLTGSSNSLVRFLGQTAYYREVKPWMVWANNVRLGMVKAFAGSHVPLSERFFAGGADSLRGFSLNEAGPSAAALLCTSEDPSTCTYKIRVPAGGHELFIWNSEGRFALPLKKGLGGVIFYDGGNVYDRIGFSRFLTDYSNSAGFGLRYNTPVGPLRIDLGRNLNPIPGLKKTQIFVTLGQAF
jgi:outer membrane protein insertion porin family